MHILPAHKFKILQMTEIQRDKVPVLVVAFNRADHVEKAMKAVREYKPDKLYLECDGPRSNKSGEKEAVEQTRKTMTEAIDWQCEVKTLFREENLGCACAVYDAITWFLKHEEWGIIIEDDVIVGQDFFKLCEDILPRYKDENRIMEVSAQNRSMRTDIPNSYVYSLCYHCWGWATWRRAWLLLDMNMEAVNHLNILKLTTKLGVFQGAMMYYYLKQAKRHLPTFNSWATRWFLSIYEHDGLVLCPGVNLAINIGTDGGVHYEKGDVNPYRDLKIGSINWPLMYNDIIEQDPVQRLYDIRDFRRVRAIGMIKKFNRAKKMGGVFLHLFKKFF